MLQHGPFTQMQDSYALSIKTENSASVSEVKDLTGTMSF